MNSLGIWLISAAINLVCLTKHIRKEIKTGEKIDKSMAAHMLISSVLIGPVFTVLIIVYWLIGDDD